MNAAYLSGFVVGVIVHLFGVAVGWHLRGRAEAYQATSSTAGDDGSEGL